MFFTWCEAGVQLPSLACGRPVLQAAFTEKVLDTLLADWLPSYVYSDVVFLSFYAFKIFIMENFKYFTEMERILQ